MLNGANAVATSSRAVVSIVRRSSAVSAPPRAWASKLTGSNQKPAETGGRSLDATLSVSVAVVASRTPASSSFIVQQPRDEYHTVASPSSACASSQPCPIVSGGPFAPASHNEWFKTSTCSHSRSPTRRVSITRAGSPALPPAIGRLVTVSPGAFRSSPLKASVKNVTPVNSSSRLSYDKNRNAGACTHADRLPVKRILNIRPRRSITIAAGASYSNSRVGRSVRVSPWCTLTSSPSQPPCGANDQF